jgi:dihydrofolate reductase
MGKLIYVPIASLDGFVADADGNFDWAAPSEEVHAFVNDLTRSAGTMLLGRRTYDVLVPWEDMQLEGQPDVIRDFAGIWRALDKIVYSRTLETPKTEKTRIEREFDPEAVRSLKESTDLGIGGPELAGQAIRAGLVDELHLFLNPVVVGGGTRALPNDERWDLELIDERRFANGVVYLRYQQR